jgi:hypothetical protein
MSPNLNRGTERLAIRFGRHVERIAVYFINFRISISRVVMFNRLRGSSNRRMLPNLNRGSDCPVTRVDRHVERIAFYFVAAWRMSRTFN